MRIAIQEDMLRGRTTLDRFETARRMGLGGVEVWARGLTARVPEIIAAMRQTGLAVSAVNHGRQGVLLHPDRPTREAALADLRRAIVDAVDLGAAGVVVVPHFGEPALPDLTPYKSVAQLAHELLHNHLRTLSDYVYAMGTDLYLLPVNRYETHFINTLAEGARVRRKIKDHPHVKLAADLFHLAMEEDDLPAALAAHAGDIGYLHLADSNRRPPGQGLLDFSLLGAALRQAGYGGWAAFARSAPGEPLDTTLLTASLDSLRRAGWPLGG